MLQVGFNFTLASHHVNHAYSKLKIKPSCPEFGIDVRYINKVKQELFVIYARLMNQYKFEYRTVFSARFDEENEDNQILNTK